MAVDEEGKCQVLFTDELIQYVGDSQKLTSALQFHSRVIMKESSGVKSFQWTKLRTVYFFTHFM